MRVELAVDETFVSGLLGVNWFSQLPVLLHACEGPTYAHSPHPSFSSVVGERLASECHASRGRVEGFPEEVPYV